MLVLRCYPVLFIFQLGAFVREDFLLEQEVRACEMIVHAGDHHSTSLWEDSDHLPALQSLAIQRGHAVFITVGIITHKRGGGEIDHLITKYLTANLNAFLRRLDIFGVFPFKLGFDLILHTGQLGRVENLSCYFKDLLIIAHHGREQEFIAVAIAKFDEPFSGFKLGQPFLILGHEFMQSFDIAHSNKFIDLGRHIFSVGWGSLWYCNISFFLCTAHISILWGYPKWEWIIISVMKFNMGELFKRIFGDTLTDLGNLEGDYRVSQLKNDISQTILYMFIVSFSMLAMLRVDAVLFDARRDLFVIMVIYRGAFVLVTVIFGFVLRGTTKVRNYDRLLFSWILMVVVFMILFNFTRPIDYLSTPFDIIVPFAIYILSPLKIKQTVALAVGFSIGTLYVDHFFKIGVDPMILTVSSSAQIIVHVLGLTSALQIHSYRRKFFQAYVDEKDAKEMVAYLANIDPLTKSLTRRQFMNIAESEFRRFRRYHRPLSILILDADRFKEINDTYGHYAGDLTLRSLSLVAMEHKRAQDTFGRLGGEEFGLLMPETTLDRASVVAERIRQMWEASPVKMDEDLIHSTISLGVAEASSADQSLEDLLRRADRMLYKAKGSGRNQVSAE